MYDINKICDIEFAQGGGSYNLLTREGSEGSDTPSPTPPDYATVYS